MRPLEYKEIPFSARIVVAAMKRQMGKLLTPYRIMGRRPALVWATSILSATAAFSNAADKQIKNLVSLRVAQIVGCEF
jgi:alkylhydroperoxidase family enzyme